MRRIVIGIVLGLLAGPAWAQPEVDALRVYLGTSGSTCTVETGSGDPAGALGCDIYIRTDGNQAVWVGDLIGQTSVSSVSTTPILGWWETDAAANNQAWDAIVDGEALRFRLVNDAYDSSLNWLTVERTANVADSVTVDATTFRHADYVSQTTSWGITDVGAADFRYLFTDELHARSFIADLEQALAGLQIITKSVAILQSDFTCPEAGGTATLSIEDLPGAADMQVFDASDWVSVRSFSRASQTLTIGDCVGQVSAPNTTPSGYQEWTFTRGSGGSAGSMTASTVVDRGAVVLDYGVSGAGYYEVNAVDGTDAANSPYAQVVTWTTAPVAANRTVRSRFGNLLGITGVSGEYGILAGTYDTDSDARYFRASNQAVQLVGVDFLMYDGATNVFRIDRGGGTAPYLSLGSPAPTTYGSGTGIWMGDNSGAYAARVGNPSGNRWAWDGTNLTIVSANLMIDSTGVAVTPGTTLADARSYRFSVSTGSMGVFGTEGGAAEFGRSSILRSTWTGVGDYTNGIFAKLEATHFPSGGTERTAEFYVTANGSATQAYTEANTIFLRSTAGIEIDGPISTFTDSQLTVNSRIHLAEELRLTADVASPGTGSIAQTAVNGLQLRGVTGSSYDLVLTNNAGSPALAVIAGTTEVAIAGVAADGTGKTVCVKSDATLGTCTNAPNASGVCTCG